MQARKLGKNQVAALTRALARGGLVVAGTGGDESWQMVESLRNRGLLRKTGTCANMLTDEGRQTAETLRAKGEG